LFSSASGRQFAQVICSKKQHVDFAVPIRFNGRGADLKVGLMTKLLLCALLVAVATPAWSQTKPAPKAARVDPCAPIGQTANRELVYSMSCNALPAPPPLPPQAEAPPPPPEPETQRSGLFGMSLDRIGSPGAGGRTP
jgi:hypothetical protein